jgi:hypothetical protein
MGEDPTKMGEDPTKIMVSHALTIKNLWFDRIFFRTTWSKKQGKHEKKLVGVHHQEWCFFLHPKHVKKVVGIQQTKRMTFKTKMIRWLTWTWNGAWNLNQKMRFYGGDTTNNSYTE